MGVTDGPDTMKKREIKHRFPGHPDSSLVIMSTELVSFEYSVEIKNDGSITPFLCIPPWHST
jgi:hypothetical protein